MLSTITSSNKLIMLCLLLLLITTNTLWHSTAICAPSAEIWPRWQTHSKENSQKIDNRNWNLLLSKYLITTHQSGINRFQYAKVTTSDRLLLEKYLVNLQKVSVSSLNKAEQKSYWINLYNSLTVKIILDHYPVKSITDIDISPGFFSNGPWGAKLLNIEKEKLSLNDIEHRILRPIFNDNRLHYALNCASLGCPNLQAEAFEPANTERLLEKSASDYINSPRGVNVKNSRLKISSIYKWFQADFGNSETGVIKHLLKYSHDTLTDELQSYLNKNTTIRYDYDWTLNQP